MKILVASDYFQPVIGYVKVQLPKQFVKNGHDVRVLSSNKYFPFPEYEQTMKSVLGKRERKVGSKMENGLYVVRKKSILEVFTRVYYRGVEREVESYRPDTVVVFGIATYTGVKMAFIKGDRFRLIYIDTHLPSEMERGNQLLKKLFYFVFRIIFSDLISRAGDKFIAAQEDTRIIIRKAYGIKKKVDLIDQGTDTQTFRFSKSARRSMRKKFKIKNDNFVIIYVGKVIASKGIDVLFKAFRQLSKEFDDIHLLIVGGSDEKYLKKCFEILEKENKNLKKKVIVVDFQEEKQLFKYYSMSDVAVWPLQDSLSMNDAAACELVFIANDKLGAKTRISNDNALLYKRGDYKDLAERIKYLYNNPEKREMMGKRGRQLAEDVLSWSSISQKIV